MSPTRTMALIMAGGRGERLWPVSTPEKPKQFLSLGGRRTMLQETVSRIRPLFRPEDVYVVVPKEFCHLVRKQLAIPEENVLVEPMGRNTAPCVGLAAVLLESHDPRAVMVVLPADHVIGNTERFVEILNVGIEVAEDGEHLVTLGIVPDRPVTGYGYIRRGELHTEINGIQVYRAEQFVEKPDRAKAEQFLANGAYYWNSGMFVWRVDAFLRVIAEYMPQLYAGLEEMRAHLGEPDWPAVVERVYGSLPSISVDYGVMERAKNVLVIPADIGWSDVGDWSALGAVIEKDEHGNIVHASHVGIDTRDSVIYAEGKDKIIATIGLDGVVIVETDEALLVADKARAQEVREIVKKLKDASATSGG